MSLRTKIFEERKNRTRRSRDRSHQELFLPDGYSEEEGEIIRSYHAVVLPSDSRWLPVNKFTEQVQVAIAIWLADYRSSTLERLERLFVAAAELDESVTIPRTKSLVRLLYDNLLITE
jgi:hypothetical protein